MNQTIQDNSNKLPENARGLCWGAFFLTFIWGIFNRVWISLLIFIPIVNIVMGFVLLFKGREWAWEKGKWQNVEHFNKVQRYWSIAGFIIVGGSFILGLAASIMIPYFSTYQKKAMRTEAKLHLVRLNTSMQSQMVETGNYTQEWQNLVPNNAQGRYRIETIETMPELADICPDCTVSNTSFKFAAVGNLDSDSDLDIVTINQEGEIEVILED